jgi:hypothetical protein
MQSLAYNTTHLDPTYLIVVFTSMLLQMLKCAAAIFWWLGSRHHFSILQFNPLSDLKFNIFYISLDYFKFRTTPFGGERTLYRLCVCWSLLITGGFAPDRPWL